MLRVAGGNLLHLLDDPDGGVIILAWVLGEQLFLKNRVWLRWA